MTKRTIKIDANRLTKSLKKHLMKQMNKVMVQIVAYVKANFGPSNSDGRNPSLAGRAPNIGTGALRNSMAYVVVEDDNDIVGVYGVRKGPTSDYARRSELGFVGTDAKGRNVSQRPRPYLTSAYRKNKKRIIKILTGK